MEYDSFETQTPSPIVFFSRCRPQDADVIDLVIKHKRVFIGWPAWKKNSQHVRQRLRAAIVDLNCTDEEWDAMHETIDNYRPNFKQNYNLVKKVTIGSIVLVPRPNLGMIFAGRIVSNFELLDDPGWADEYLQLREAQGLNDHVNDEDYDKDYEEAGHVADVAQTWAVDRFRPIPFPLVPAWIRKSLFGRSTYGEIHEIEELDLRPYDELNNLIEDPKWLQLTWTTDETEIERRLVSSIGPATFEHLCVALLQIEHPDEIWAHVGGSGDGGVDGVGSDNEGRVTGILQCKWKYDGDLPSFATPWTGTELAPRRILAALIHSDDLDIPSDICFLSRKKIVQLIAKHAALLPTAISMRIGDGD